MKKIIVLLFLIVSCLKLSYAMEVTAVNDFKLNKYLGKWYEIARLPNRFETKCIAPVTAEYFINPEDKNLIVVNECNTKNGEPEIARGAAHFTGSSNVGKLKVSFVPKFIRWLQIGYGDYWVLSVDYDKIAVVGSPDHKYLWILSRSNNVSDEDYTQALSVAKSQGFDIANVVRN